MTAKRLICYRTIALTGAFIAAAVFATSFVGAPVNRGTNFSNLGVHAPLRPASLGHGSEMRIAPNYGALPLVFEENEGQTDPQVKYAARTNGYTVFLTPRDAVLTFHSSSRVPMGPGRNPA